MPYKTIIICSLLIACSAVSGAWWGFKQGQEYGSVMESVSFAHISTAQVDRLESGNRKDIERVIELFNLYINHGVDRFYWYAEHGNKHIAGLFYEGHEEILIRSMKGIATFRASNPEKDFSSGLSGLAKENYLEAYRNRKAVIEIFEAK